MARVADSLAVWDGWTRRLTVFAPDGAGVRTTDHRDWFPVRELAWSAELGLVREKGASASWPPGEDDDLHALIAHRPDGSTDTLASWHDSAQVSFVRPGRASAAPVPFGPAAGWDVAPDGGVLLSEGRDYRITELGSEGRPVRVVSVDVERPPLAGPDADSARDMVARMAPELREEVRLPRRKPATGELVAATDGAMWVRTYTEDDVATQTWHVFTRSGLLRARAVLPAGLRVQDVTAEAILATRQDSLGVDHVDRYRYELPEPPSCPDLS